MKKLYFTGAILMMGLVSFGQGRPEKAVLKQSNIKDKAVRTDIDSQRGGGGAIWSDDFSDPSTWVAGFDAAASSLEWEFGNNLGSGGGAPIDTIMSTTAFNGYAMIDSDEYGGENGGTEVEDSWFTTASHIDLSGFDNVVLQFETQYYRWTFEDCYVVISTNNTDWPELTPQMDISAMPNVFNVWPGADTQDAVDNPTLKRINISEVAGGQDSVWVRFNWTGTWGYCWFIDDVAIVEQPADDIVMESAYVSHNGTGDEYGRIPTGQTGQNWLVGSQVYNFGSAEQTNLAWTADFTGASAFNISGGNATLASDSTIVIEDMNFSGVLSPGLYEGTFTVASDGDVSSGSQFGNNVRYREFMVTEDNDMYSLDGFGVHTNQTEVPGSLGTNSFGTDGADSWDGLMLFTYYAVNSPIEVHGMRMLLANGTVEGGSIVIAIHDTADILADNVVDPLEQSDIYTVSQADIENGYVDIFFDEAFEMESNGYYASCELFSNADANRIRILDDETVPQPGNSSLIYLPNDAVFGNGNALAICLLLSNPDGIEDYGNLVNLSISPNPSNGIVRVGLNLETASSNLNIKVTGVDGAEIMNVSESNVFGLFRKDLDLSDFANGMYLVVVTSDNGVRTERIMIAH